MNLQIIKDGLIQRVSVSEHLNNYPITNDQGDELDADSDPSVLLFDAAASAEEIVDVLIANPELQDAVLAAINAKRNPKIR